MEKVANTFVTQIVVRKECKRKWITKNSTVVLKSVASKKNYIPWRLAQC